jgi:MinD superfamily P-loop ATPase
MKTLVVLSGKGGAGKTTLSAGLLPFLPRAVIADADVDASNLPLLLRGKRQWSEPFVGGQVASVEADLCAGCLDCLGVCRFNALADPGNGNGVPVVDRLSCEGCAACGTVCPNGAIKMIPELSGYWFLSETRFGPLVHARLGPGGENSGALVERVRREATRTAEREGRELILVDGPPGTGCPVISSVSGADLVLAVTEPTPSGESDLDRVLDLARHFQIKAAVVLNKHDLDSARGDRLEKRLAADGVPIVARIPYDETASEALCEGRLLSEFSESWHDRLERLWQSVAPLLNENGGQPAHETDQLTELGAQGDPH